MMINDDKWWQMISDIRLLYFKTGGTVNPTKICRGLTLFICWMNETRKPFVELKRSNWTIAKYSYFEICYDVLWYFMMYKRTYIYIYIIYIVMSIATLLFAKFWEWLLCRRGALKRSPSTNLAVWTPSAYHHCRFRWRNEHFMQFHVTSRQPGGFVVFLDLLTCRRCHKIRDPLYFLQLSASTNMFVCWKVTMIKL